jgi:hypothetical protein
MNRDDRLFSIQSTKRSEVDNADRVTWLHLVFEVESVVDTASALLLLLFANDRFVRLKLIEKYPRYTFIYSDELNSTSRID